MSDNMPVLGDATQPDDQLSLRRTNQLFAEVYEANHQMWYAIALRLTKHPQDAEDLVNEAIARTLDRERNLGCDVANFSSYVVQVMYNTHFNEMRKKRGVNSSTEFDESIDSSRFEDHSDPEKILDADDVRKAMAALPKAWREVLWYTEVEGYKARELVPQFGPTANAVAALAARARDGLRVQYAAAQLFPAPSEEHARYDKAIVNQATGHPVSASTKRKLDDHVADCSYCAIRLEALVQTMKTTRHGVWTAPMLMSSGAGEKVSQTRLLARLWATTSYRKALVGICVFGMGLAGGSWMHVSAPKTPKRADVVAAQPVPVPPSSVSPVSLPALATAPSSAVPSSPASLRTEEARSVSVSPYQPVSSPTVPVIAPLDVDLSTGLVQDGRSLSISFPTGSAVGPATISLFFPDGTSVVTQPDMNCKVPSLTNVTCRARNGSASFVLHAVGDTRVTGEVTARVQVPQRDGSFLKGDVEMSLPIPGRVSPE